MRGRFQKKLPAIDMTLNLSYAFKYIRDWFRGKDIFPIVLVSTLIIFFGGILFSATLGRRSITEEQYKEVNQMVKEMPSLKPLVVEAMEFDKTIDAEEFTEIKRTYMLSNVYGEEIKDASGNDVENLTGD